MTTPPPYISGTSSGGFTYSAGESVTIVSGGKAYDMTINSGGNEYIEKGGTASTTTVNYSGNVYVSAGIAYATTINSGGTQNVAGGKASGTIVNSGGVQSVSKGSATSATVHSGGTQDVGSGGREYGTILAGGGDHIYSGGKSYNEQVQSGGFEFVTRGGVASNSIISAGGSAILANNVLYHDTFYARSGSEVVSGIYKNGTETITLTGAPEDVFTKIVAKGNTKEYFSGSELVLKTVRHGNKLYTTDYTSSGSQTFSSTSPAYKSGGIASGMVVESGGTLILDGGKTKNLTVHSGGTEIVGGTVSVTSAGGEFIFFISNVTVSNTGIGNGVTELVKSTDTTASSVVSSGGTETISAGGTAENTTIDGGTLNLLVGAKTAGHIGFAGTGGELVVSAAAPPATTISGFAKGDEIKLAGIAYVSGATASVTTAGVVTITDGGKSYHLNIANAAVGESFDFSSASILTLGTGAMSFLRQQPAATEAQDWRATLIAPQSHVSAASHPATISATFKYGALPHDQVQPTQIAGIELSRHLPTH